MKRSWCAWFIGLAAGLFACGDGSTPIPILEDQTFELLDDCVTDFSAEEGDCLSIVDGRVEPFCSAREDQCVEHFYVTENRGRPFFVHVNAYYPCYPQWVFDRYNDAESDFFLSDVYRKVSLELASDVVDDNVHIIEVLRDPDIQTDGMCYYRLEASITDLTRGEYNLTLWNPKHELILRTVFTK